MKVYKENERMRVIEGYGSYFNKRYEVERPHKYYDKSGVIQKRWHLVFWSSNLNDCIEYFEKYKNESEKKYFTISIKEALELWG